MYVKFMFNLFDMLLLPLLIPVSPSYNAFHKNTIEGNELELELEI